MKNSSDTIGNRTSKLQACSAVCQPTAPPGAPETCRWHRKNGNVNLTMVHFVVIYYTIILQFSVQKIIKYIEIVVSNDNIIYNGIATVCWACDAYG